MDRFRGFRCVRTDIPVAGAIVPKSGGAVYPYGYNDPLNFLQQTYAGLSSRPAHEGNRMSAREDILARVRANLGVAAGDEARRDAAQALIAARTLGPRPQVDGDLAARFAAKSSAMSSTVEMVPAFADVPAAVARYLAVQGLATRAVCWPQLAVLDWAAAGLQVEARAANGDDPVGITGCFCAIAETGTLMLRSGPETAATTSLLPETHIAVVPVSRIVPAMEEGFALLRNEYGDLRGELPRAINFVSGPSRTGDIEQTIVLGAHGPYRVHLLVVTDA
jgi:L-lactate dehydrogenase complex protein LldG